MKKLFSKVVAFAFILCASIAMFACGTDDKVLSYEEVFANAYNYMVEHGHIASMRATTIYTSGESSNPILMFQSKYKYNGGNYKAQVTQYFSDGVGASIFEIDKTKSYVRIYTNDPGDEYESVTTRYIQADEVNEWKQTALISYVEFDFIGIVDSNNWFFNKNDDVYTGKYIGEETNITVTFDDTKLLSIKTQDSDDGGTHIIDYTFDYSAVTLEEIDFASKVDVEAYKTTLASQIANLKATTWTATTDTSKTVSHTANETTVTFNGKSKNFDEVIPAFNSNSIYYSADKYTDGTVKLSWANDDDTYTYILEGNVQKSVKVYEYHGNDYTINF